MALHVSDFKKMLNQVLFEFVGTFFLVLCVQLVVGTDPNPALVIGILLAVLVYAGGPISGAHVNPAVSLGAYLRSSISFQTLLMYWVVQFAGGFVGALVGRILNGKAISPAIGLSHNLLQSFLAELFFTTVFVLVILLVVPKSGTPPTYYGAAIGLALYVAVACTASISGGAINPAVAISLILVKNVAKLHYALWISLAEALGAVLAVALYFLVDSGEARLAPDSILRELRTKLLHPSDSTQDEVAPLVSS